MSPVKIPNVISGNLWVKSLNFSLLSAFKGEQYITFLFKPTKWLIAFSAGSVLPLPVCAVIKTFLSVFIPFIAHF